MLNTFSLKIGQKVFTIKHLGTKSRTDFNPAVHCTDYSHSKYNQEFITKYIRII